MAENQPAESAFDPELVEYVRVDPSTGKLLPLEKEGANKPVIAKPTAPNPPPPEIIPKETIALAIVTSPDVCRSPQTPIPYMTWGMGFDNLNYSPDVRANGQVIKLQSSKFWCCYGDEPGVGRGIKSNTVGDVVEPVTSSTIVRANGQWVQRHTDRCTLNSGNAPGEYVLVKSVQTDEAPDGKDEQNKTRDEQIAEYAASKGWTRAADGGWNTNPGGFGWASNDKVGEEMDYVNSGRGNVQPFSMGSGPSELKSYTPSWTENIEHSVQDRLMSWGMDKYQAGEYGRKVGGLAGFVPGVGNGLSANDASRSFSSGNYLLGGIQSIGAIIGIGPGRLLTKGLEKGAEKVVQTQVERVAVKALEEKAAKEAAEAAAKKKAEDEAAAAAAKASGKWGARSTQTGSYKELRKKLKGTSEQANHMNQDAAFRDVIPSDEGIANALKGNAFKDAGSPHYEFHKSLEGFWDQYRRGGALEGGVPTIGEYDSALRQALGASGYSSTEVDGLARLAAENRAAYGLNADDVVPRIPGRINQSK